MPHIAFDRMLPARLLEHSVFLRELMPQDLTLEIDQLTQEEAVSAARYVATVVGKAPARSGKGFVAGPHPFLQHCELDTGTGNRKAG